jgi:hypothetical protein
VKRILWLSTIGCLASGVAFAQGNVNLVAPKDSNRGPHAKPAPGRVVPPPQPPTGDTPESVTVVLGPEYRAPFWRRFFAGEHYRGLWLTPIRLPVLDLARFAGGLTPVEHGGGEQTVSLHVKGADGVEYVLRSINKAPKVPDEMKGTIVEKVVADQTSAANPAGVLIAARLEEAANVLHVEPQFYVIPDDPRLGAFRAEFAGMIAEVEGRPKTKDGEVGLEDASKVVKTDKLFESLNKSESNRVDARGYLTARLVDFEIGDWDRGESQWRWARFGDKGERVWKPIPLDRDWAFTRSDGLVAWVARPHRPELIIFGDHFPSLLGLTFEEWDLDRRLMQDLDRPTFDSTAQWLKTVWSDSVIRDAVAAMPPELQAKRGEFFTKALERRRDKLPAEADRYYRQMAWGADVHATTEPSVIDITRHQDTVFVQMRVKDAPPVDPYFARSFVKGETHEIRLYLDGGPDSVTERGGGDGIKIRLIPKVDGDVLVDSTSGGPGQTRIYDYGHAVRLVDAHAIGVDGRRWTAPRVPPGTLVRDVGEKCETEPGAAGGSDAGAVVGINITCNEYGFRRQPWALSNSFTLGYASAAGGGGLDYFGQLRPVGGHQLWTWHATATTSQFTWFFGYGNNTTYNPNLNNGFGESFYRARQSYFQFNPGLTIPFNGTTSLTVSPFLRYWDTERLGTLIETIKPYGVGALGTIGGTIDARYDTRDAIGYSRSGVYLNFRGLGVPDVWDAQSAYGKVRATAATYLTPPEGFAIRPTLALRVGGEKVWGTAPFEDMAHIGASAPGEPFSVRGYISDRFTGTAAAFGNAQLELPIFQPLILVRTTFGLLVVNDIGRVFLPGEHSSTWHDGYGGGFFVAPFSGKVTANFTLVHGTDGNRFYFGYGTGL